MLDVRRAPRSGGTTREQRDTNVEIAVRFVSYCSRVVHVGLLRRSSPELRPPDLLVFC